jgi:very-short-patch-repair endonuclease
MTIVYNHKHLKPIKRLLREQDIGAEKILWGKLRNRQQKFKFKRQYSVGGYIVDFYCPKLKLAVEIDGATHSTEEEIKKDKEREKFLKRFGIKVIRYINNDVYRHATDVVGDIYEKCLKRERELKCSVRGSTQPHPIPLLSKERGFPVQGQNDKIKAP